MQFRHHAASLAFSLLTTAGASFGQSTMFMNYQGQAKNTSGVAGKIEVRTAVYSTATGGESIAAARVTTATIAPNGQFNIEVEFPPELSMSAAQLFLEVAVGDPTAPGEFTVLGERTLLPPKTFDPTVDAIRMDASGNIGIGTDVPRSKLEVANGQLTVPSVEVRAPSGSPPYIDFAAGDDDWNGRLILYPPGNEMALYTPKLMLSQHMDLAGNIYFGSNGAVLHGAGTIHITARGNGLLHLNPWGDSGDVIVGGGGGPASLTSHNHITAMKDVNVGGTIRVNGGSPIEFGANVPGKDPSAGTIGYKRWSEGLDIVGAGTNQTDRKVTIHAEGGTEVRGNVTMPSGGILGFGGTGHVQAEGILYLQAFRPNDGSLAVVIGGGGGTGNLHVIGNLHKGAGSFRIDHPLDPENKFLFHSFVESPDMMNIYNGNVVTDSAGYATIQLPDYFEALNRDFRYQLTVIDESDDMDTILWAKVVREVEDNQFTLRSSRGNVKVSWQVTGIRQDAYAEMNRIQVEVDKNESERGKYLAPEAFGKGPEMGIYFGKVPANPGRHAPSRADDTGEQR